MTLNAEDALTKLPAQIRATDNDSFNRKQGLEGARLRLKLREADVAIQIAKQLDAEGKKSNAETRDAMLRATLSDDAEALALRKTIVEEEGVLQRMASTITFYRDVFNAAKVLVLARSPGQLVFDEALP